MENSKSLLGKLRVYIACNEETNKAFGNKVAERIDLSECEKIMKHYCQRVRNIKSNPETNISHEPNGVIISKAVLNELLKLESCDALVMLYGVDYNKKNNDLLKGQTIAVIPVDSAGKAVPAIKESKLSIVEERWPTVGSMDGKMTDLKDQNIVEAITDFLSILELKEETKKENEKEEEKKKEERRKKTQ
ncbi:hypothetical protein LVD17_07060 [Fulvivirga ulvae]|uniref:hypothetical protein n=1 Tax=Fulvivirga ulvae TaxID=2904245 RepID=UPI001F22D01D|nr:hypothetical protein [Fulvivirga ulvae]UII32785.1 hypothetical protein LVD17_02925 [Fulvivirga ulvae]UII33576.1 hypothetical protein LVD17_07060 [Fulvivirga ulvae]